MKANPGGYIPPQEVIGRDQLTKRLWRILARQSLLLTAERRMGKTSILRKLKDESPADILVVFHELEHINSPLEFVQLVYDDVSAYLSRSRRSAQRVRAFLQGLKGLEAGSFSFRRGSCTTGPKPVKGFCSTWGPACLARPA